MAKGLDSNDDGTQENPATIPFSYAKRPSAEIKAITNSTKPGMPCSAPDATRGLNC